MDVTTQLKNKCAGLFTEEGEKFLIFTKPKC